MKITKKHLTELIQKRNSIVEQDSSIPPKLQYLGLQYPPKLKYNPIDVKRHIQLNPVPKYKSKDYSDDWKGDLQYAADDLKQDVDTFKKSKFAKRLKFADDLINKQQINYKTKKGSQVKLGKIDSQDGNPIYGFKTTIPIRKK